MLPYPSDGWTHFAPVGRSPALELQSEVEGCLDSPLVQTILDTLDSYALVLNAHRQILAASPAFLNALGLEQSEVNHALRPGEALDCVHAAQGPDGCGSSEACRGCGAVLAILAAQGAEKASGPVEGECLLSHVREGRWTCSEFKVKASPLSLGEHHFVVLVLRDISSEKRREALERIFLHDIANSLQGLRGWAELLEGKMRDPERAAQGILRVSEHLADEVASQRLLLQAEQGQLEANMATFPLAPFLEELDELLGRHACSAERHRELECTEPRLALRTDRSLLLRVVQNMAINALEATPPGGTVRLRFTATPDPVFHCENPGSIPPEVAERIFQRSFSTKGQRGRGLGTYSMKLLGEGFLKGRVSFTTDPTRGTCFSFRLSPSCLVRLGS